MISVKKKVKNLILVQRAILAILVKHKLISITSAELFMDLIPEREKKKSIKKI